MADDALNSYLERNNLPPPPPSGYNPDWYDSYDHNLPPPMPPRPPCPHCHSHDLEKYGFELRVGGKYYTGSGSSCCPIKVTVTQVTATTVTYVDSSGTEHQKDYHDFMTSSWRDKSL